MRLMYSFFLVSVMLFAEDTETVFQEVSELLKAEISQQISAPDFEVKIDNWTKVWGKEKESDLSLKGLKLTQNQSRFQVQLEGLKTSKRLYGKIEWYIEIPTLSRIVHPGEEIQEDDLEIKRVPSSLLNKSHLIQKEQIIGKAPRFSMLKPGIPLSQNDLQNPIVIKKGGVIRVHYNKGCLHVTNRGIAQKDGSKNMTIPVEMMTPDSKGVKKTIYAVVMGSDDAEIKL